MCSAPSFTNSATTPWSRPFTSSMNLGGNDHSRPTISPTFFDAPLPERTAGAPGSLAAARPGAITPAIVPAIGPSSLARTFWTEPAGAPDGTSVVGAALCSPSTPGSGSPMNVSMLAGTVGRGGGEALAPLRADLAAEPPARGVVVFFAAFPFFF